MPQPTRPSQIADTRDATTFAAPAPPFDARIDHNGGHPDRGAALRAPTPCRARAPPPHSSHSLALAPRKLDALCPVRLALVLLFLACVLSARRLLSSCVSAQPPVCMARLLRPSKADTARLHLPTAPLGAHGEATPPRVCWGGVVGGCRGTHARSVHLLGLGPRRKHLGPPLDQVALQL